MPICWMLRNLESHRPASVLSWWPQGTVISTCRSPQPKNGSRQWGTILDDSRPLPMGNRRLAIRTTSLGNYFRTICALWKQCPLMVGAAEMWQIFLFCSNVIGRIPKLIRMSLGVCPGTIRLQHLPADVLMSIVVDSFTRSSTVEYRFGRQRLYKRLRTSTNFLEVRS